MNTAVAERDAPTRARRAEQALKVCDCDIHPNMSRPDEVYPFLAQRWQDHARTYGGLYRQAFSDTLSHPRINEGASRRDSWPPGGGPPGSSLEMMQAQLLDAFNVDVAGKDCLDLGSSTGGFTQVLLSRGAAKVYAVDVGHGQLHASLQGDPRIVSMEATDARALVPAHFTKPPQIVVSDVSFISLRLVLPHALALAAPDARLIALVKPQFEAGRANVSKGVVRNEAVHARVCEEIAALLASLGWRVDGLIASPIEGGDGNKEFLIGAARGARSMERSSS